MWRAPPADEGHASTLQGYKVRIVYTYMLYGLISCSTSVVKDTNYELRGLLPDTRLLLEISALSTCGAEGPTTSICCTT